MATGKLNFGRRDVAAQAGEIALLMVSGVEVRGDGGQRFHEITKSSLPATSSYVALRGSRVSCDN
jgi:hypothetical protein